MQLGDLLLQRHRRNEPLGPLMRCQGRVLPSGCGVRQGHISQSPRLPGPKRGVAGFSRPASGNGSASPPASALAPADHWRPCMPDPYEPPRPRDDALESELESLREQEEEGHATPKEQRRAEQL